MQYPKGETVTVSDNEHPGTANEITLTNTGSNTVTVTVTITGYSTQLNSASINGAGGSAGDALVNNGDGTTSWAAPGRSYQASGGGVVVTPYDTAPGGHGTIASLELPAGKYELTATVRGEGDVFKGDGAIDCKLLWDSSGNPRARIAGGIIPITTNAWSWETEVMLGQLSTVSGGSAAVVCESSPVHDLINPCDRSFDAVVDDVQLIAVQVGQLTGRTATDSSGDPTSWFCS